MILSPFKQQLSQLHIFFFFWVCIRDLEQHCWYVHNAFSLFYLYLPMFLLLTSVIPNHFVCCRVLGPVLLLVLLFMSGYALYGSHKGEFIYLCKVQEQFILNVILCSLLTKYGFENNTFLFLSNVGLMILKLWLVLLVAAFQELHPQQVGAS